MTETLAAEDSPAPAAAKDPVRAPTAVVRRPSCGDPVLWLIVAVYVGARLLEILPNPVPRMAIVALDVLSAMAFALVHGAREYGLRGILRYIGICIVVGNLIENVGVMTGIPFGRYYFVELMGPKLFNVPILLGLAYIGMSYVSWMLARLIAGSGDPGNGEAGLLNLPIVASFIMVAWDLAQDPVWSTVLRGWVWNDGGPWFGVPVSNYFGWYLTVFIVYLLFAASLRRRVIVPAPSGRANWRLAVVFYAVCAAANVLQRIPAPNPAIVADPTGKLWRVADITGASALVSVFVMGAFAAMAWARIARTEAQARD